MCVYMYLYIYIYKYTHAHMHTLYLDSFPQLFTQKQARMFCADSVNGLESDTVFLIGCLKGFSRMLLEWLGELFCPLMMH